jgi:hypothetical protein
MQLYVTEMIEVDGETWGREAAGDVEAYVAQATTAAWRVLEAIGRYDLRRPAALLVGDTEGDIEAHLAARVIVHAQRMNTAIERSDILAVQRQAIHFATAVERAMHLDAWGRDVAQLKARRRRGGAKRGAQLRKIQPEECADVMQLWHTVYAGLEGTWKKKLIADSEVVELLKKRGIDLKPSTVTKIRHAAQKKIRLT